MVNHGRSAGCLTCKQRRVKCDEEKPKCRACRRLKLNCRYRTKYANLRIKDETHKFHSSTKVAIRHVAEPDAAVPFFLQHYATMGRDVASTRGFYEMLVSVYARELQSSPLSLAVAAVAEVVLALWRHNSHASDLHSRRLNRSSNSYYTQAVRALRHALDDRNERGKPATMLAVLSLQLHDNVTAVYGVQPATRIHHDGALSLLPFAAAPSECVDLDPTTSAYVRNFIFHSEISSALRQGRGLDPVVAEWIGDRGLKGVSDNPSATLDAIGAATAEFQARYIRRRRGGGGTPLSREEMDAWRVRAKCIDDQLVLWAQTLPAHWRVLRLVRGRLGDDVIDASIPTYRSICEVYTCSQVGATWNIWRVQRLLLTRISLSLLGSSDREDGQSSRSPQETGVGRREMEEDAAAAVGYIQRLQELVDSICYSVPFFLGNRARPSSMSDFTDPAILFPRVGSSPPPDAARASQLVSGDPYEQHFRRHIIAQGPWHLMNSLSRLLTLFADHDHGSIKPAALLRQGQHEWISRQFVRVVSLLHLWSVVGIGDALAGDSSAEDIARGVRKGAVYMTGP